MDTQNFQTISNLIVSKPDAKAYLHGIGDYYNIGGNVSFYKWANGTIVKAEIINLPKTDSNFFGFHVHSGKCSLEEGHYNPEDVSHPLHAGDLPVLLSNNGYAYTIVFTSRFYPESVKGGSVVIHLNPDDYRTQPSGNSGQRIACGDIV